MKTTVLFSLIDFIEQATFTAIMLLRVAHASYNNLLYSGFTFYSALQAHSTGSYRGQTLRATMQSLREIGARESLPEPTDQQLSEQSAKPSDCN